MTTLAPERLEEIAAGWRSGLDLAGLPNPAGPRFEGYTEYEITLTGLITHCTNVTGSNNPVTGPCSCCIIP